MQERHTLERRIVIPERRTTALTAMLLIAAVGVAVVSVRAHSAVIENLRVRQITVVDQKGVERVWIGAPVPDPLRQGVHGRRIAPVSGVIVIDAKGNERAAWSPQTPPIDSLQRRCFSALIVNGGRKLPFW